MNGTESDGGTAPAIVQPASGIPRMTLRRSERTTIRNITFLGAGDEYVMNTHKYVTYGGCKPMGLEGKKVQ